MRFVVCGGGDAAQEIDDGGEGVSAARCGCLGWRPDVETVYAAADLVLLTSDNEGMPVSLIEAGLAGLPSSRHGSAASARSYGTASPACSPTAARTGSPGRRRLLLDEPLRREMGHRAHLDPAAFGPDRLVSDVDGVYAAIAERRGLPAATGRAAGS